MPYTLTITSPPETSPVSLSQLKSHLKINTGDDDDDLQIYLNAAVQTLTEWTGYVPVETEYQLVVTGGSIGQTVNGLLVVTLPRHPATVTQVEAWNADDTFSELDSSLWRQSGDRTLYVDRSAVPHVTNAPPALRVTFTAGASSVLPTVKLAVLQLAGLSYRMREAATDLRLVDVPFACRSIIEGLKGGTV